MADAPSATARAPRVVLDSNIWIAMLIFRDAAVRPILDALEADRLDAVISPACREELRRALAFPQFARHAVDHDAALAWVDRIARSVADPPDPWNAPRCKDRDDQKFLALACAAGAAYLVSRDKAVLKLKRRMARQCGVTIAPPGAFIADAGLEIAQAVQPTPYPT